MSEVEIEYALPHPELPELSVFEGLTVPLTPTAQGWIAAVDEGPRVDVAIVGPVPTQDGEVPKVLHGSAIAAMTQAAQRFLAREYDLLGQLVAPAPTDIQFRGDQRDLRAPGDTTLTIQVFRSVVGEVRSIGFGERLPEETDRIDHPAHRWIRENTPLDEGDLLRRRPLDRFAFRLNRHPGRQVDVAIAPFAADGVVAVDYLVAENKPWSVYTQVANTGTISTDEIRVIHGFVHTQFTGRDDILRVDYATAAYDESNAVIASYDVPITPDRRLRLAVDASWSEFSASDVGLAGATFEGESFGFGGEFRLEVFQRGPLFVDLLAGARWESIDTENRAAGVAGRDQFLLPRFGARLERVTELSSLRASGVVEFNLPGVATTSQSEIQALGRVDVERSFAVFRGGASYSFFLEPLLAPRAFAGEFGPDRQTLAHEVVASVRGQTTFGQRVIANAQQVAGGLFTVRGYEESASVGDNAVIGSLEYRFHLGRVTPIRRDNTFDLFGSPFRPTRQQAFGSSDWDVQLRAFFDAARVDSVDTRPFEADETLLGIGVGTTFVLRSNLIATIDYGFALSDAGSGETRSESGDGRLHFSVRIAY